MDCVDERHSVEPEPWADAGRTHPRVDRLLQVGYHPARLHEGPVREGERGHAWPRLMIGKRSSPRASHGTISLWSKLGHGDPFQQASAGWVTMKYAHRGRSMRLGPAPWTVRWVCTVMSPTS